MAKGSVTLAGHFPAGSKVEVLARSTDQFIPEQRGEPAKTVTVNKYGTVEVNGLNSGPYWIVQEDDDGRWKSVRVLAKGDGPESEPTEKPNPTPAKRIDAPPPGPKMVQGARSSANAKSEKKGGRG